MIKISVWGITFTGIIAVFLVLWILAEILGLVGRLIPEPISQTIPQETPPDNLGVEKDIVIITSLMKHLGMEGKLRIRRID
ncbi:MAG: hypothetical protein GX331_04730 [Firmicutes bacterium]|nr:hypothetical protein [Bacillota bacterium]